MNKKHLTIGILILVILVGGVFLVRLISPLIPTPTLPQGEGATSPLRLSNEQLPLSGQVITENGAVIAVRVADTAETRQKGLSGFQGLDNDQGMLFLFDQPGMYPFWMKDMHFAIDIIWLKKIQDQKFQIVHIEKNVAPETFPQTFVSNEPADAVLEMNSGMVDVYNLEQEKNVWITF
jgi:uncharacterized membrane protein (UPF0127 family)